jgi:hypothetical protein
MAVFIKQWLIRAHHSAETLERLLSFAAERNELGKMRAIQILALLLMCFPQAGVSIHLPCSGCPAKLFPQVPQAAQSRKL